MSVTLSELPFEILLQIATECDYLTKVILSCTSVTLRKAVTVTGVRLLSKHDTCYRAAEEGYTELLKWCRDNNCPWDEDTCYIATDRGHFEALKVCIEGGCKWDSGVLVAASIGGRLDIVKWCGGELTC